MRSGNPGWFIPVTQMICLVAGAALVGTHVAPWAGLAVGFIGWAIMPAS